MASTWMIAAMQQGVEAANLRAENKRMRALISWVDGMLVDDAEPALIRAGINRWRSEQPDDSEVRPT